MTTGPNLPPCPRCGYEGRIVAGAEIWTASEGYTGRERRYKCQQGHAWRTVELEIGLLHRLLDDAAVPNVIGKVIGTENGNNRVVKLDGKPFKEI